MSWSLGKVYAWRDTPTDELDEEYLEYCSICGFLLNTKGKCEQCDNKKYPIDDEYDCCNKT